MSCQKTNTGKILYSWKLLLKCSKWLSEYGGSTLNRQDGELRLRSEGFNIIIMNTRPKPAYCRQGQAGVSLRASGAQLGSDHFSLQTHTNFIIISSAWTSKSPTKQSLSCWMPEFLSLCHRSISINHIFRSSFVHIQF